MVVEILRLYQAVPNAEKPLVQFGVMDSARQILQLHGKVGILHLSCQRLFKTSLKAQRSVDIDFSSRQKSRREKREALDVVPMGMSDQNVDSRGCGRSAEKRKSEFADTGAAVEDKEVAVFALKLDAGCVAPIAGRSWPGGGNGASGPPEAYKHENPFSVREANLYPGSLTFDSVALPNGAGSISGTGHLIDYDMALWSQVPIRRRYGQLLQFLEPRIHPREKIRWPHLIRRLTIVPGEPSR